MLLLTLGFTHPAVPAAPGASLDFADVAAAIPRLNLPVAAEQRVSRDPSSMKGLSHGDLPSA